MQPTSPATANATVTEGASAAFAVANARPLSVRARLVRSGTIARMARVGGVFGAIGGVAAARGSAPPTDIVSLAGALGEAAGGGLVAPQEVRWEPSLGSATDATTGRWVLFLSQSPADGTRDVWRARVRISPEGRPIAVTASYNLTATPLGDDHLLVVRDHYAAFATTAYGQVQSVTLLDLAGEGDQNKAEKLTDEITSFVTNVQRTGTGVGIARFDVTLEQPARAAGLTLGEDALLIDLADERTLRRASVDYAHEDLTTRDTGMHIDAAMHLPKRPTLWAVDTVRAVPWIGPGPIAWLEDHVFGLKDDVKRFAFSLRGSTPEDQLAGPSAAPPTVLDTSEASLEAAHWPPPKIATMWKTPEAGEGEWVAPTQTWIRKVPATEASSPSPFMETFVRPDEERPYSKVRLVAMDMRQLDVDMEAGSEDPQPLTGPTGPGKLSRDPAIFQKVVACFNGAFKTEHGHYGMMVHKRILLPPIPGAATVITTKDNRVGLGSWGSNKTVSGITGLPDDDIVSFRQNLDALVDHGQVNPTGRTLWGYSAPGKGIQTERTGLCATTAGHLVYAWGDDVSATTLAKGMQMAGCDYAMHLDMNPYHTGFIFTNITDLKTKNYRSELLDTGMEIPKERFIEWAPKDFFYVMVHDPTPPLLDGASAWTPDPGTQPAPSWMPGLWDSQVEVSHGQVDVLDIEPGRARFRIRAGSQESPGTSPLRELAADDAKRVLLATGMGVATEKRPRGFATDGRLVVTIHGGEGTGLLLTSEDGQLSIVKTADGPPAGGDLAELPLILDDGNAVPSVEGTSSARAAIGLTAAGRVMIARGTFTSDAPLADALKRGGCTRAVALDRGTPSPAFVHRAGQSAAPLSRYDESVLYAIANPLKPRAFRFDAASPTTPTK